MKNFWKLLTLVLVLPLLGWSQTNLPIRAQNINNIRYCDQFPGNNFSAKVIACIAALPATGTADARGITGSQSATSQIAFGGKTVNLLLGPMQLSSSYHDAGGPNDASFVMSPGSRICGAGIAATTIRITTYDGDGINPNPNVIICDLTIQGNSSTDTSGQSVGIEGCDCDNVIIDRVEVRNFTHGINAGGLSSNWKITNNKIHDNYLDGILLANSGIISAGFDMSNNQIYYNGSNGIDINSRRSRATNNIVYHNGFVIGPMIGYDANGILSASQGGPTDGNVIANNIVYDNYGSGITARADVYSADNIVISGNMSKGNGGAGIYLDGSVGASCSHMNYLTVTGNNTSGNAGDAGILIGGTGGSACIINGTLISGNVASGNTGRGIYNAYGLDALITNNVAMGNAVNITEGNGLAFCNKVDTGVNICEILGTTAQVKSFTFNAGAYYFGATAANGQYSYDNTGSGQTVIDFKGNDFRVRSIDSGTATVLDYDRTVPKFSVLGGVSTTTDVTAGTYLLSTGSALYLGAGGANGSHLYSAAGAGTTYFDWKGAKLSVRAIDSGTFELLSIDQATGYTTAYGLSTPRLKVTGSTSGGADIVAPAAAGSPTLTLPTVTGTFGLTTGTLTTAHLAVFDSSGRIIDGGAVPAGGSIPGSDKEVMFNDGGALGTDPGFVYDKTANRSKMGGAFLTFDIPNCGTPATQNLITINSGATRFMMIGDSCDTTTLGNGAGQNSTDDSYKNTYIGSQAGFKDGTGAYNNNEVVAVGMDAFHEATAIANSTATGNEAAYFVGQTHTAGGDYIVANGHSAMHNCGLSNKSVAVGANAAECAVATYTTNSASNFVAAGYRACAAMTTSQGTICIGYQAADNITTAGNSIFICNDCNATSTTADNQLLIGTLLSGNMTGSVATATFTVNGGVIGGSYLQSAVVAIGSLPTCNGGLEGAHMGVNDALTPVALATVANGGSAHVSVYCNGTNWVVQ